MVHGTFFQYLVPLTTLLLHSIGRNVGVPDCKIIFAAFCALLYDARSTYHLWSGSSHAWGCMTSVWPMPSGGHDGSLGNDSIGVYCLFCYIVVFLKCLLLQDVRRKLFPYVAYAGELCRAKI